MTTALVLSGGGAKGSFEIGALQYLYENGFLATVICSTSVGSVNAIQLAHGGTVALQRAAFDRLKTIWQTELTFNQDMYVEAAWLQRVTPRTRAAITDLFSDDINVPSLVSQVIFFPPYAMGQAVVLGVNLSDGLSGLMGAQSLFTLEPIRAKINRYLNREIVASSGVELRLVAVSLDSGAIRYITQDGRVLETNGSQVTGTNSLLCPEEQAAYNQAVAAHDTALMEVGQARRGTEGLNLQAAQQELKRASAELDQARARLDQCMAAETQAGATNRLVVKVEEGVIASASIPCAFPPVLLGDESYVDGGVRWVLPLKAALDLGADSIVAINASPAGVPPATHSYHNSGLLNIAERSLLEILLWEIQERHLEVAKLEALQQRRKVWVVTPRVDVHNTLTIDPGLIEINIGYGYMCAADMMTTFEFGPATPPADMTPIDPPTTSEPMRPGPGSSSSMSNPPPTPTEGLFVDEAANPELASLADAIARCRRRCWELEHQVFRTSISESPFSSASAAGSAPRSPEALDEVRLLKSVLGLLVSARQEMNGKLPADATTWADQWERHRWVPSDAPGVGNTPWNEYSDGIYTKPAATRPTALVVKAPDRPEVFLISPFKQWITSEAALFQVVPGVGWAGVRVIPAEYIDAFPRREDIVVA